MIHEASIADCEAAYRLICELENRALPRERFCEIFREQLADARYRCLVCEREGEVAGLLNLRFEAQLHHADRIAEILEFVVSSERRGRGLGRELLRYAEQLARECGCAQIEAASNRQRTDAHRFYLREGFEDSHIKFVKLLLGEDQMKKCRITAVRQARYDDLIAKYENPLEHACDVREGDVFIANGWQRPEGLCLSAWESMSPFVLALAHGGEGFYDGWMKNPKSAMISCNDGFRPVSFLIEALDEEAD